MLSYVQNDAEKTILVMLFKFPLPTWPTLGFKAEDNDKIETTQVFITKNSNKSYLSLIYFQKRS